MEIWKSIKGYEGLYEISNLGRVRSLDRLVKHPKGGLKIVHGGIKVIPKPNPKTGYVLVSLYKGGKGVTISVHRLVAFAFPEICGEYFDGAVVDHIDTVRSNNRADNLRWCTISENHLNPITYEREMATHEKAAIANRGKTPWNKGRLLPQQSGENHWKSRPIKQIDKAGKVVKEWVNIRCAAITLNITPSCLYNCLTGRSRSAAGFRWEYL